MKSSSLNVVFLLAIISVLSACGGGGDVSSPSEPGVSLPAQSNSEQMHYVKMITKGQQGSWERDTLINSYDVCVLAFKIQGRSGAPEPLGEIPEIAAPATFERYMGAHRIVEFFKGVRSVINPSTCAQQPDKFEVMNIEWPGGGCSINLIKKSATGGCSDASLRASESAIIPADYFSTLPAGERRTIAGYTCDVYFYYLEGTHFEGCVFSQKISPDGTVLSPYPYVTGARGTYIGMNLLEINFPDSPVRRRMEAVEVKLNQTISKDLLKVPDDIDRSQAQR